MATVPVIQDNVQLQTQTGRRRFSADADAYGGAEARGLANVGQGLASVAEAADKIDLAYSEARAREADNTYAARLREEVTAYTNSQLGRNAVDNRAAIEARIAEIGDEVGSGLSGRAANAYREAANRRAAGALGDVAEHSARQARAFQIEQIDVAIDNATNDGVAAFADPEARDRARERGVAEVNRLGALQGWDETITANRRREFASDFNARIITQLAVTDPEAAQALYTAERSNMDAQSAGELLTTMRVAQNQAQERVVGAVYQAFANGQDYRSIPEWRQFTTNPLFGQQHAAFIAHMRAQREQAASVSTAQQDRESRRVADDLLARATDEHLGGVRMLDLVVQAGQGRLGPPLVMRSEPGAPAGYGRVMTDQDFQRATGMTYAEARQRYNALRGDGLRGVLGAIGQVRQAQEDAFGPEAMASATNQVMAVAEARANALGVATHGQGNARQTQARLRDYIYRRVRQSAASNIPIDPDAIANEALADVSIPGMWGPRSTDLFQVETGSRITVTEAQAESIIDAMPQEVSDAMMAQLLRQHPNATEGQLRRMLAESYANARVGAE